MIQVQKLMVHYHKQKVGESPAYDLTFCPQGYNGEHATTVNNNGNPTWPDMLSVGINSGLSKLQCEEIYHKILSNLDTNIFPILV